MCIKSNAGFGHFNVYLMPYFRTLIFYFCKALKWLSRVTLLKVDWSILLTLCFREKLGPRIHVWLRKYWMKKACLHRVYEGRIWGHKILYNILHTYINYHTLKIEIFPKDILLSHLKSVGFRSCIGMSLRKEGAWHRGLPVTKFFFRSHSDSHPRWQLQLNGLDKRFLPGK